MVRIISGILLGLVAVFVVITLVEYLVELALPLYPLGPDGPRPGGPIVNLAWPLQLIVVAGWLLGALAGALAAGWIARRPITGWVPAALVVVAGIVDVTMIPHPLWMSIAAILAPLVGGWIGVRLARARS